MSFARPLAAMCLLVAACAKGSDNPGDDEDVDARQIDAPSQDVDASPTDAPNVDAPSIDAPNIDAASIDAPSIDAATTDAMTAIDASVDAATDAAIDAGCTTMVLQRLTNPAFDLTPMGTGWAQTPYNAAYPIVTGDDGLAEHTAPYKAWLGGWDETATDSMYQQVTIPAGTTQLTLRGQYASSTDETGTTVYDTCNVELLDSSGGLVQSVMSLSNVNTVANWTAFQFTFSNPQAGQTRRVNFRSSSDISNATAFFFDSLALEATVCQ